ncbi:MAG TPA: hypothetical protein VKS25_01195 [Solirubrobacteraceae bacterium]|nr:hypothetical protein [Solirubrobacteraceae bacterium]
MRFRDRAVVAALLAALGLTPLAADAAKKPPVPKLTAPDLWATVDVCNTAAHPDTIGVRGSMPGTGDKHEEMYMRFVIEYQSGNGHWHYFNTGGISSYIDLGDASAASRQAGQNFQLGKNVNANYLLRGVIQYEWRLGGRNIGTTVRSTSGGHQVAAGGDPPGFSAAFCTIQANRRGSLVITPVTPSPARRAISAASSTVHT